jgi:hypothetical protein
MFSTDGVHKATLVSKIPTICKRIGKKYDNDSRGIFIFANIKGETDFSKFADAELPLARMIITNRSSKNALQKYYDADTAFIFMTIVPIIKMNNMLHRGAISSLVKYVENDFNY